MAATSSITITLSGQPLSELKSMAEPFVDTPESLVARLIHEEIERRGTQQAPMAVPAESVQDPVAHESLFHAKLLAAWLEGRELPRPKWSGLLHAVHALGMQRLGSFEAVRQASSTRIRQGKYEGEGFKHIPGADMSIQGVDANLAWDQSLKLAQAMGVPIKAVFAWRQKPEAVHPGQRGVLEWNPVRTVHVRSPRLADPRRAAELRKQIVEVAANA